MFQSQNVFWTFHQWVCVLHLFVFVLVTEVLNSKLMCEIFTSLQVIRWRSVTSSSSWIESQPLHHMMSVVLCKKIENHRRMFLQRTCLLCRMVIKLRQREMTDSCSQEGFFVKTEKFPLICVADDNVGFMRKIISHFTFLFLSFTSSSCY